MTVRLCAGIPKVKEMNRRSFMRAVLSSVATINFLGASVMVQLPARAVPPTLDKTYVLKRMLPILEREMDRAEALREYHGYIVGLGAERKCLLYPSPVQVSEASSLERKSLLSAVATVHFVGVTTLLSVQKIPEFATYGDWVKIPSYYWDDPLDVGLTVDDFKVIKKWFDED